jgi:hypothetical protein
MTLTQEINTLRQQIQAKITVTLAFNSLGFKPKAKSSSRLKTTRSEFSPLKWT